jgi:hypothetical protein
MSLDEASPCFLLPSRLGTKQQRVSRRHQTALPFNFYASRSERRVLRHVKLMSPAIKPKATHFSRPLLKVGRSI